MDTFVKFPQYRLIFPHPIISPKGYLVDPKNIGEHLKKRRLDLGLLQIEVAKIIGVTESTIWNWEHGTDPELRYIPKIIEFLGYVPFECPENPIGRLKYFKLVKGLSYERLGELMGRDPEQLMDWLSGRIKPVKKIIKILTNFF